MGCTIRNSNPGKDKYFSLLKKGPEWLRGASSLPSNGLFTMGKAAGAGN
jgi:hypothetical protein